MTYANISIPVPYFPRPLFSWLYDQIPPDLDTHGSAESLEELVARLQAKKLLIDADGELKPGPNFQQWLQDGQVPA